ncbi:L-histidine N(alpha)-methyltransferase [Telmatobacter bradus]|uniref:L-histidine N(alpha)-methyltransferase n=1 Tax=Telmatobacter bradus TaxID=474953 RepID=UPI003B431C5B
MQTELPTDKTLAAIVRSGLTAQLKRLPAWLFYDAAGSQLFERITELPEYYLTRVERTIFARTSDEFFAGFGQNAVRITELGAGSADKTRLILAAALRRQPSVVYEPVDVSATALDAARERIERELPAVRVAPCVADYTHAFELSAIGAQEHRLLLFIGSSLGNFDPAEAAALLHNVRAALRPGDCFLLGVDLVKDECVLLSAYDDAAGVTAAFNKNMLVRLNRELGADFDLASFAHRAVWNAAAQRMEMHLESRVAQSIHIAALDLTVCFAKAERLHTENSYKYQPGEAEQMLVRSGFTPLQCWMDPRQWFAVVLAQA